MMACIGLSRSLNMWHDVYGLIGGEPFCIHRWTGSCSRRPIKTRDAICSLGAGPYKRVDLAIESANRMKFPLKIIGTGQDEKRLRRLAGPSVELLGWQPDSEIRHHYARCKALLFPGEEDFGIVPLEAMACGKAVIAYARGGASRLWFC